MHRKRSSARAPRLRNRLLRTLVAFAVLPGWAMAAASSLPSDTFTNNRTQRQQGDLLDGVPAETGAVSWQAYPSLVFGRGRVVDSGASPTHVATLPFDPTALSAGDVMTVSASLSLDGAEWVAIGFVTGPTDAFWSGGALWVLLRPSGFFNLFVDRTQNLLAAGFAPVVHPEGDNDLALRYDPAAERASVVINGQTVLPDLDLSTFPPVPSIGHAGFHLLRLAGAPAGTIGVDEFAVDAVPADDLPPAVTVSSTAVTITGVHPGATVALTGAIHVAEPWMRRARTVSVMVEDDDDDGTITHVPGDSLAKSLWVAVETSTGRHGVGGPSGFELRASVLPPGAISDPGYFRDERSSLYLTVVRPGDAVWTGRVDDGAPSDAGVASDGGVLADLLSLSATPVTSQTYPGIGILNALAAGDVVVGIDPLRLEYYAFEVTP